MTEIGHRLFAGSQATWSPHILPCRLQALLEVEMIEVVVVSPGVACDDDILEASKLRRVRPGTARVSCTLRCSGSFVVV